MHVLVWGFLPIFTGGHKSHILGKIFDKLFKWRLTVRFIRWETIWETENNRVHQ